MPTTLPPRSPEDRYGPTRVAVAERLRVRRRWIVALGALFALLGIAALVLVETATIASVLTIGLFMAVAGLLEIVIGFRTRTWGWMLLWEASGLLYLLAGLSAVAMPELASVIFTLLLGAGLLATGIVRMVLGLRVAGSRSRGGIVAAGLITIVLGLLIILGWPGNSVVVLGTFLGIDLLLYGTTLILFGVRLGARR